MKHAGILVIVATGAAFGWFAPDLSESAAPATDAPAEAAAEVDVAQWNAGEVVLERAGDGHFYADVTVDSMPAQMLVDTGASMVALTGEDAEAIGIEWNESDIRPVARGANGAVYGVPVMLERVQLGEIEAQQVEAIVVPEGLGVSLLGQSFLSKIDRVEVAGGKMTLGG